VAREGIDEYVNKAKLLIWIRIILGSSIRIRIRIRVKSWIRIRSFEGSKWSSGGPWTITMKARRFKKWSHRGSVDQSSQILAFLQKRRIRIAKV